jgi:hypothetical protein
VTEHPSAQWTAQQLVETFPFDSTPRYLLRDREQAWEPWLLYMLEAVEDTALWTTHKIISIRNLADHTGEYVRQLFLNKSVSQIQEGIKETGGRSD